MFFLTSFLIYHESLKECDVKLWLPKIEYISFLFCEIITSHFYSKYRLLNLIIPLNYAFDFYLKETIFRIFSSKFGERELLEEVTDSDLVTPRTKSKHFLRTIMHFCR